MKTNNGGKRDLFFLHFLNDFHDVNQWTIFFTSRVNAKITFVTNCEITFPPSTDLVDVVGILGGPFFNGIKIMETRKLWLCCFQLNNPPENP